MNEQFKSTQHPTREQDDRLVSLAQDLSELQLWAKKHEQICYLAHKATQRFLGNAGQDECTKEAMTEAFRQVREEQTEQAAYSQEEAAPWYAHEQAAPWCAQEQAEPWYTQEDTASHFAQNQTLREAAHFQPFVHIKPEGEGDVKEVQGQVTNTGYLPVDNSTEQQALHQIIFGQYPQN